MSPHIKSIDCQTKGKNFVGGVSKILKSPESTTEYGLFYKKCKLDDYTVGYLKVYFENMMLCQLMCCCNASPAKSVTSKKEKKVDSGSESICQNSKQTKDNKNNNDDNRTNFYQICVKDILDAANGVRDDSGKRNPRLPETRFTAELSINKTTCEVGRCIMNPQGESKKSDETLVRPDIAILKEEFPSEKKLTLNDIERLVEMKFPTEKYNMVKTIKQLRDYTLFKKPILLMMIGDPNNPDHLLSNQNINLINSLQGEKLTIWYCLCENDLMKEENYSPAAEKIDKMENLAKLVMQLALMTLRRSPSLGRLPAPTPTPVPAGLGGLGIKPIQTTPSTSHLGGQRGK